MMRKTCALVTSAVLLWVALPQLASATSYEPVRRHDEPAPGGRFVLDVNPDAGEHVVYAVAVGRADRTRLWSFKRALGFDRLYLSSDGEQVAVLAWHFVRVGQLDNNAFELWTRSGLKKRYTFKQLVARPSRVRGAGPIGGFWRRWRSSRPLRRGDQLEIETTGSYGYALSLRSGEIERRWLVASGIAVKVAGHGLQLVALLWLLRVRRAAQDDRQRRRDLVRSSVAPLLSLLASGTHIAGLPLVPPLATYVINLVLSAGWLIALLPAIGALRRRRRDPGGKKPPTLGIVAAMLVLPLCHLVDLFSC